MTALTLRKLIDLADTAIEHRMHADLGVSEDIKIVERARRELERGSIIVAPARDVAAPQDLKPTNESMRKLWDEPNTWHEVACPFTANAAYHLRVKWTAAGFKARTKTMHGRGVAVLAMHVNGSR